MGWRLFWDAKHRRQCHGANLSPAKALALLKTPKSGIVPPPADERQIRLGRVTASCEKPRNLLHQLGLTLPNYGDCNDGRVENAVTTRG